MDEKVLAEVSIDGKTVETEKGAWKIVVRDAWQVPESSVRHLRLELQGAPTYRLKLEIPAESLHVEHRLGDYQWILDAIVRYLEQPTVQLEGRLRVGFS